MKISKKQLIIFFTAFISTIAVAYFCNLFLAPSKSKFFLQFFTEGYNFRKLQSEDKDFAKYRVGDKIDLNKLVTTDDSRFTLVMRQKLLLLVVIDPVCGYCKLSKDIMEETRKTAEKIGIDYYPVLFTSNPSKANLKKYAQSLGFEESLKWENISKPPELFAGMPTPAHILVDRDGTILQIWFSSNNDEKIRKRMSDQLSADLLLINDIFKALQTNQAQN